MNAEEIINRLDRAVDELHAASKAAFELARRIAKDAAARLADDDEWTRLPAPKEKCRIAGWSRSKVNPEIEKGNVRKKRVAGCAYYSAADVRRVIAS